MSWYRGPSLYSQKMRRLGSKIFNEYRAPPMPKEVATSSDLAVKKDFKYTIISCRNVIERQSREPHDLNSAWNPNWYPAHPQIRELTHTLRQYGLFRDEHRDFIEEMKRLRIIRGKVYRQKGSKGGKKARIRELDK
ncbi:28S ribosomal protein S33, mitochondrial-like [Panonychus citri]|uniref:28S ribosomal protein S33, mitochondrial-like n=1 Tax=Panonychus citri TaxID=50023 RepID=UPI0023074D77|nr:28S ribosomal protein S33, mitochondrial-like [Panonychus citri]